MGELLQGDLLHIPQDVTRIGKVANGDDLIASSPPATAPNPAGSTAGLIKCRMRE